MTEWVKPSLLEVAVNIGESTERLAAPPMKIAELGLAPGWLCGVALTGANQLGSATTDTDGRMTVLEIGTLDLSHVRLFVLSACETNVGTIATGAGVLGLQRAWESAGVHATVASLWQVSDVATAEWMSECYRPL